ncbi:MAG: acetyl/propionyl/methylcrotonyl-CoA carboxylase subunit alpha [Acidimicrobiia bacterium]
MITTVLVANRGEIARRVFRTCRTMGLRTVAVFSDPDRDAPFVREADEAHALGGSTAAESYLRIDRILEIARRANVDAVHPGYGFLSENAEFARAVTDAGFTWIGPSSEAIARMGSKLESKQLISGAGVPTLPSIDLTGLDESALGAAADEIGFPVLVKASTGGGGKGMRIVADPDELAGAVAGARREAEAAFGDGTVFLEKCLVDPRHVEIQVFGDTHGNLVSLHERECSIQRRHQKIVEEAPSPAVDADLRRQMGEAAVAVARAVDYVGAGTVEFLLAGNDFYFLEMNTRLQVEHPVTEAITGLDLVRLQFLVAMGEPLPPEALTPRLDGHAIEVRLYAEDARNGFLPAAGRLSTFDIALMPGVRVDSGVESGSNIPVFYDPMLAKIIVHAPTRTEAARMLATALQRSRIHGSITNRDLLVRILRHPEFGAGTTDTGFLIRHDPALLAHPLVGRDELRRMALAAALFDHDNRRRSASVLTTVPSGWRNNPSAPQTVAFRDADGEVTVRYRMDRSTVSFDDDADRPFTYAAHDGHLAVEMDGVRRFYRVEQHGTTFAVDGPDGGIDLTEIDRHPAAGPPTEPGSLHAPMPGKVLKVLVSEGDAVQAGAVLLVMEAMKMEHTLRAPVSGVVAAVRASEGDQVEAEAPLIVIGEES